MDFGAPADEQASATEVTRSFLDGVRPYLGGRVLRVVLFGSRARGDATEGSDFDILVVVDRRDEALDEALYAPVMEVLLRTGKLVSLKVFPERELERLRALGSPFVEAVLREGIVLA